MRESLIEVRIARELALRLGAIEPMSVEEHRGWRARGDCLMVRDPRTLVAMFWPIVPGADLSRPPS